MGLGGGGVAAGVGEAARQLVGQGVEGVEAPFARQAHRLLVLFESDAVHAVEAHDLGVDQRLFISKGAGVNPRPEGDLVVMKMDLTAQIGGKGLRG